MNYRVEFNTSAAPDTNGEYDVIYDRADEDERTRTVLLCSDCTREDADRIVAAIEAATRAPFLADSRNKGWALAKDLQSQVDELRKALVDLCANLNERNEFNDPAGHDRNTSIAAAYHRAIALLEAAHD